MGEGETAHGEHFHSSFNAALEAADAKSVTKTEFTDTGGNVTSEVDYTKIPARKSDLNDLPDWATESDTLVVKVETEALSDAEKEAPGMLIDLMKLYQEALVAKVGLDEIVSTALEPGGRFLNDKEKTEKIRLDNIILLTDNLFDIRFGVWGLYGDMYDDLGSVETYHSQMVSKKNDLASLAKNYFSSSGDKNEELQAWFDSTAKLYGNEEKVPKLDFYTFKEKFKNGGWALTDTDDIKAVLDKIKSSAADSNILEKDDIKPDEAPKLDVISDVSTTPEVPLAPLPPEKIRTKAEFEEVLKEMLAGYDNDNSVVKDGPLNEKVLTLLYSKFLYDLKEGNTHNLSKAYQEAKKSLDNIQFGGEAAKFAVYMKSLHLMAGLGEYEAKVDFALTDSDETRRGKITTKLKEDFNGLAEKIAKKAMDKAVGERVKFLASEKKTNEVLSNKNVTRSEVREAVYEHGRVRNSYHEVMDSYAFEISGSNTDVSAECEKDEKAQTVESLGAIDHLPPDEKTTLLDSEYGVFILEVKNPNSIKILEEIKADPSQLESTFFNLVELRRQIEHTQKELARSANLPPEYACNLVSNAKELMLAHKMETARVRLNIAEKRRDMADRNWEKTKKATSGRILRFNNELKAKIETFASRADVIKSKFDAGMATMVVGGMYQPIGLSQLKGVDNSVSREVPILSKHELSDILETGVDAYTYYSESFKNMFERGRNMLDIGRKIPMLDKRVRLMDDLKLVRYESKQKSLDFRFQAKLDFTRSLTVAKWRIEQEFLATTKGKKGREQLNARLEKLKERRGSVKLIRNETDNQRNLSNQQSKEYLRKFDKALFAAFGEKPTGRHLKEDYATSHESFNRLGMKPGEYEVIKQTDANGQTEYYVVYVAGKNVIKEKINSAGNKITEVTRSQYESEDEATYGMEEVIEDGQKKAEELKYKDFQRGLFFTVAEDGKLVLDDRVDKVAVKKVEVTVPTVLDSTVPELAAPDSVAPVPELEASKPIDAKDPKLSAEDEAKQKYKAELVRLQGIIDFNAEPDTIGLAMSYKAEKAEVEIRGWQAFLPEDERRRLKEEAAMKTMAEVSKPEFLNEDDIDYVVAQWRDVKGRSWYRAVSLSNDGLRVTLQDVDTNGKPKGRKNTIRYGNTNDAQVWYKKFTNFKVNEVQGSGDTKVTVIESGLKFVDENGNLVLKRQSAKAEIKPISPMAIPPVVPQVETPSNPLVSEHLLRHEVDSVNTSGFLLKNENKDGPKRFKKPKSKAKKFRRRDDEDDY